MDSLKDLKVGSLIDWRTFSWHAPLVEALFPSEVARRILSTYIPSRGRQDCRYWASSKNGSFTVKSAYEKYPGCVGRVSSEVWKKVWAMGLSLKYGLFIWKVLHGILAVKGWGLRRRNMVNDDFCSICGVDVETGSFVLPVSIC